MTRVIITGAAGALHGFSHGGCSTARMRKLAQRGHFASDGIAGDYASRLKD